MDIDKFLDREIKEIGHFDVVHAPKNDKEEKGSIKLYSELWNKVSDAKFNWDSNLYTDLTNTGTRLKEEMETSFPELENKKKLIKQNITKALRELENKNHENATKLYSEISDMRSSLSDNHLEEKLNLNREIFQLYEKIHNQLESKFIINFKESISKIEDFLRNSFSNLEKGHIEEAKKEYLEALNTYKDLPNGFLSKKIELGNQFLALYKDLSINAQIKILEQQLDKKSSKSPGSIGNKDIYPQLSDLKLQQFPEIVNNQAKSISNKAILSNLRAMSEDKHDISNKTIFSSLVSKKLDKTKINLKMGIHAEPKNNIESVLNLDPDNVKAKKMLSNIPIKH